MNFGLTGTLVQQIRLGNISLAKTQPLADFRPLPRGHLNREDRVQVGALGEGIPRVVHNRVVVVRQTERIDLVLGQLVKVVLLTLHDVVLLDDHVVFTIWPGMFMPKAHHVTQLVHHDAKLVAILADRNGLRTIASLTNEGATSESSSFKTKFRTYEPP